MIAGLRARWQKTRASYWFYPALFTTLAAIMAFATVWIDRHGGSVWLARHEWIDIARPEGARNVLNVIAGSMIGVASTVFSITIAAVVYASGSYGPRLLSNFMEDRGNQLSLATFIATFVYAVLVLRVVRDAQESAGDPGFVPQISLLIATLLMGISIALLVYFLNHVPSSIRINAVLEGIARKNVGERGRNNRLDAQIAQCPSGMFTARSAAKIVARNQDGRPCKSRAVKEVVGVCAQSLKRATAKPLTGDRLEPFGRDDNVGIDVLAAERDGPSFDLLHRFPGDRSRLSLIPIRRCRR